MNFILIQVKNNPYKDFKSWKNQQSYSKIKTKLKMKDIKK